MAYWPEKYLLIDSCGLINSPFPYFMCMLHTWTQAERRILHNVVNRWTLKITHSVLVTWHRLTLLSCEDNHMPNVWENDGQIEFHERHCCNGHKARYVIIRKCMNLICYLHPTWLTHCKISTIEVLLIFMNPYMLNAIQLEILHPQIYAILCHGVLESVSSKQPCNFNLLCDVAKFIF